jgi:hypothetical protein
MNPSNLAEVRPWPHLRTLLEVQLDAQFADLRTLLRLPRHDETLDGSCNLTSASLLFNIVSGSSVLFYNASIAAMADGRQSGERFRGLLEDFYPFLDDDLPTDDAARVLYRAARNPLTHCLGVGKDRRVFPGAPQVGDRPVAVMFSKALLSVDQVAHVASTRARPDWLGPTIAMDGAECVISVATLAWGVHELLRTLFGDEAQARRADAVAAELLSSPLPN